MQTIRIVSGIQTIPVVSSELKESSKRDEEPKYKMQTEVYKSAPDQDNESPDGTSSSHTFKGREYVPRGEGNKKEFTLNAPRIISHH